MKVMIFLILLAMQLNQAIAGGDPVRGESTSIICIGCHERDGNSTNPVYPKLAAQGEAYLTKQLIDFKNRDREEEHMTSMVEALSWSDIPDVAAYFSRQKRKASKLESNLSVAGKTIYNNGVPSKNIFACAGCHGVDGSGKPAMKYPALAGQHAEYITKQLKEFRSGTRHNDKKKLMQNVTANLTDEEIEAVSTYISSMN